MITYLTRELWNSLSSDAQDALHVRQTHTETRRERELAWKRAGVLTGMTVIGLLLPYLLAAGVGK